MRIPVELNDDGTVTVTGDFRSTFPGVRHGNNSIGREIKNRIPEDVAEAVIVDTEHSRLWVHCMSEDALDAVFDVIALMERQN